MIRVLPVLLLLGTFANAAAPGRPVVLELFTSQGCSSCPPADKLLRELAQTRADLLPLAFHVTYWNQLGWKDPYSFEGATARQASYHRISGYGGSYTPQMVIDGAADVVGSDRAGVAAAVRAAVSHAVPPLVEINRNGAVVSIEIGAGVGAGRVLLIGYDPKHRTEVPRGENAGSTLVEANIVRDFVPLGDWNGTSLHLVHSMPKGERLAVLIQAPSGHYLAATSEAK